MALVGAWDTLSGARGATSGLARGLNSGRVSMRCVPCNWRWARICRRIVGVMGWVVWWGKPMPLIWPKLFGLTALFDGVTLERLAAGTGKLEGGGKTPGA